MNPRACENKTCPHNSDKACAWGAVTDIEKCDKRTKPAPGQPDEVEKQLRDAGATTVENHVAVYDGGNYGQTERPWNLIIYGLTPARAVAALRAAKGTEPHDANLPYATIARQKDEFDKANTEIARLKGKIAEARKSALTISASDEGNGKELWLHFGQNCMVSIGSLIEKSYSPLVKRLLQEWADAWLARNKAVQP